MPSLFIDGGSLGYWRFKGKNDSFLRAKSQVEDLLASYQRPEIEARKTQELTKLVSAYASQAGMEYLPEINFD